MRTASVFVSVIGALGAISSEASAQSAQEPTSVTSQPRDHTPPNESAERRRVGAPDSVSGAAPTGVRVETTPTLGLVVGGASTFAAMWVPSLIASALTMRAPNSQAAATLMIPGVGPFLWAAIGIGGFSSSDRRSRIAVLAFDGVMQSFGVGLFIAGFALRQAASNPPSSEIPSLAQDSIRQAGIALTVLGGVAVAVGGSLLVTDLFASGGCIFSLSPGCGANSTLTLTGAITSGVGFGAMLVPGVVLLVEGYSRHASTTAAAASAARRASGPALVPSFSFGPTPGGLRLEVAGAF